MPHKPSTLRQQSHSSALQQKSYTNPNYEVYPYNQLHSPNISSVLRTIHTTHIPTKQTIYWDVDDTILDSSKEVIAIINNTYNFFKTPKSVTDLRDWDFKSIANISRQDLEAIFDSEEFWANVQLKPEFTTLYNSGLLSYYNNVFITKGSDTNITRKDEFLKLAIPAIYTSESLIHLYQHQSKSLISMHKGIQIDDNFDNLLDTNAHLKILLTNGLSTEYNKSYATKTNNADELLLCDNLYYVSSIAEVQQILEFNIKHPTEF